MNFLYQRKLMSTCFPGKSGEANPTQKPVVSEKQVSYNVGGSYLNTELKNAVKAADLKAQYDARVKRLVGHKRILAQILIKTVDEFKGMNPKAVADCIEGTPYISAVPVEPGLTNAVLDRNGQRIVGFNTENQEINEGLARFDIVFYVRTKDGLSQIIINVEAQKDEPGEYEILNRAIFYVSRLVSSQKERDFENSSYNDIKRVYSIWICMNMEENTMSHIHLTKEDIRLLAAGRVSVSHCIGSNTKAGKGVAPVRELLEAGIPVGLGTDGASSGNTLDLFMQMRLFASFHKTVNHDRSVFPAKEIVRLATCEGAKALHMEKTVGSLEPGKKADIILVETDSVNMFPCYDPYSALVYSANPSNVDTVLVNGRILVRGKKLRHADLRCIREELDDAMGAFRRAVEKWRFS